jgi:3-hydroxybutyryl-CoA dehydrogenase
MSFSRAVIVGAGTMGHGIAHVCAMAGIRTTIVDQTLELAQSGKTKIEANLKKGVDKGKVTEAKRDATIALLDASDDRAVLRDADLLIEAIPERMDWKRELFAYADKTMPADAVLATNTSSLSITEIASSTARPENVIGLHFFNPVHIMKLLEIVRGAHTSEKTLVRAERLGLALEKTTVVVNDAPGFATSRLGITLGNEAMRMVEEGVASPKDIDTALKLGYGHPMGPLALSDLVGLDVRLHITRALFDELGTDGFRPPQILRRLVRAGHIGKKCGRGFYIWKDGEIVGVNPLAVRSLGAG